MRGWWQDLTDLVLPAECGGCGRPRTVLCPECRAVLSGAVPRRVRPVPEPPGLPVVHAAARYADEVRAALLAHKERGALALSAPLGTALAGAVRTGLREAWARSGGEGPTGLRGGFHEARPLAGGAVGPGSRMGPDGAREGVDGAMRAEHRAGGEAARARTDGAVRAEGRAGLRGPRVPDETAVLLVPVPSSRGAVRTRGHDPARRLAFAAAGELRRAGTPARVVAVLRQRRAVADQSGLNSRQRLANLAGALVVAPGGGRLLSGGRVVLVDDLMTTGASLTEAARAVRAAMTAVVHRERATAVYEAPTRECRGERMTGVTEEETGRAPVLARPADADGACDLICAAVVAASPDSFEINRN
ncbi:ComF family protein [Streptomyces sp. NL15-2K]|uniref:ComF family protein n=1 Tax=Streptomyces sp. NL15-2K TaxID=376149 RepID=UPI000F567BB7|nr:ComF family protein [Streptomyces sp. NL15-2K]